jgi:diacylglycerol kinase (ATP)
MYRSVPKLHVLVCGGDGSVGWVIQYLFSPELGYTEKNRPPVSVLPLGTGNDMSQTLGWGIEYAGEDLSDFLTEIEQANIVHLDRWSVDFTPSATLPPNESEAKKLEEREETTDKEDEMEKENITEEKEKKEETTPAHPLSILIPRDSPRAVVMNNYISIGWDAKVSLDFHALRETNSYLCQSRIGNKFLYALYGVKQMVFEQGWYLENILELEVRHFPPSLLSSLLVGISS